jgi:hypothetical protein
VVYEQECTTHSRSTLSCQPLNSPAPSATPARCAVSNSATTYGYDTGREQEQQDRRTHCVSAAGQVFLSAPSARSAHGLMTLTWAARHSTRLETLGRTVKQFLPHSLTSLSSFPLSVPSSDRLQSQASTLPQGARPVSFGHYSLSGPQPPKFGQLLDEDGVTPIEKDDIIHAAWYDGHGRWVPSPLQMSHQLIHHMSLPGNFYCLRTRMVSKYGIPQISTPSASFSISQQSAAFLALLSYHVLMHATTNTPSSSCSLALPPILSYTSTRSPRIRPSIAIRSLTQRPFNHQTVSLLYPPHTRLPLSMYSRLLLSSSPSSTSYLYHTFLTPSSHYRDVFSHTHHPLHHPRQLMQTSMPMLPQTPAQPRRQRRLWTQR